MQTNDPLLSTLQTRFGLPGFRGLQEPVIRAVMDGHRALAIFPTGGGKSLCYQLPGVLLDGLTVVVSPLIALMADQVAKLQALDIPAARLDSTIGEDEEARILEMLAAGGIRLLYLSPERFCTSSFRKVLRGLPLAMVAIDEAHCVSEWGHNFRPDYLRVATICRRLRVPRILALTATATPAVRRDLRRAFRIATAHVYQAPARRPNLQLHVEACAADAKDRRLLELLRETEGPAIVYATTRNDAERIAALIQKAGIPSRVYHAGCKASERAQAQEAFMRGSVRVVAATIAFGMGIDKPDIRTIIHYHLPKCLEGYCQETGRAGRDGLPSRCVMLAAAEDTLTLANFIHGSTPRPQSIRTLLDRVLRLASPGKRFTVSLHDLSVSLDIREETIGTLLAHLELSGIIERIGSYHDLMRAVPVRGVEPMLAGRPAGERRWIGMLFTEDRRHRGEYRFPLADLSATTGVARERIAGLLLSLEAAGDIRLTRRGLRVIFRLSRSWDGGIPALAEELASRFGSRADFEHERIGRVLDFIASRSCRAVFLERHFGRKGAEPCGVCDRCLGEAPVKLSALPAAEPDDSEWAAMRRLRDKRHPALASTAQLARFLCGIHSPAALQAKLHFHDDFGLWKHVPYATVTGWLEG